MTTDQEVFVFGKDMCLEGTRFHEVLKAYTISNRVIVSFTNFGFVDMALNLYESFKLLDIQNYIIFALDHGSFEVMTKYNVNTIHLQVKDAIFQENTHNFGSVEFNDICNLKPALVLECIKGGFDVIWTDTDIVWLKVIDCLHLYLIFNF